MGNQFETDLIRFFRILRNHGTLLVLVLIISALFGTALNLLKNNTYQVELMLLSFRPGSYEIDLVDELLDASELVIVEPEVDFPRLLIEKEHYISIIKGESAFNQLIARPIYWPNLRDSLNLHDYYLKQGTINTHTGFLKNKINTRSYARRVDASGKALALSGYGLESLRDEIFKNIEYRDSYRHNRSAFLIKADDPLIASQLSLLIADVLDHNLKELARENNKKEVVFFEELERYYRNHYHTLLDSLRIYSDSNRDVSRLRSDFAFTVLEDDFTNVISPMYQGILRRLADSEIKMNQEGQRFIVFSPLSVPLPIIGTNRWTLFFTLIFIGVIVFNLILLVKRNRLNGESEDKGD